MLPLIRNCGPNYQVPDWEVAFGRQAPLEVDLGCGRGTYVLECAQRCSKTNFIGLDTKRKWIEIINQKAHQANLSNLKALRVDVQHDLPLLFADNSVHGFTVHHPDPWWKKRHRKRRLIQSDTVELLTRLLQPQGFLFCQTDVPDLADEMHAVFEQNKLLREQDAQHYLELHMEGVMSHRARKCQRLGIPVRCMVFQKVTST